MDVARTGGEDGYYNTGESCIMEELANCTNGGRDVLEKTLIEPSVKDCAD